MARRSVRNPQSAAKFTGHVTEKAAVGLFRWMVTDHSGMGKARMPSQLGFMDSLNFILGQLLIGIAGAVLTGVWIFVLIAYGLPYFLFGHF